MHSLARYVFLHFDRQGVDFSLRPRFTINNLDNVRGTVSAKAYLDRRVEAMQLETLKIFCDVVRSASFSRGARENDISQSSASQAVHQLESRLGVKLIDRSKRPLVLTPQGKVYYEGCKDLVERYLEVENRVKALHDEHNVVGTVTVASIYSVGLSHMTRFVQRFMQTYTGAKVKLEFLHPTRVVESVLAEDADLGLVSYPKRRPELVVIPWRDEPMALVAYPRHPLASFDSIPVDRLTGERFVSFDEDLSIRRAIDRYLRSQNVHVETSLQFDNIENIKRAVESEAGVAILPLATIERELQAGTLVAIALAGPPLSRPIAIIHKRSKQLGLTASRFFKLLTDEGSRDGDVRASIAEDGLERRPKPEPQPV
jgi:DNA-binding transcriptional LysR family regulator